MINALYGKVPNLDNYTAEELALIHNEFKQLADGFKLLASYAEARANIIAMQNISQHRMPQPNDRYNLTRFEDARQWVFNKLPTWARWA